MRFYRNITTQYVEGKDLNGLKYFNISKQLEIFDGLILSVKVFFRHKLSVNFCYNIEQEFG